jgi:hypothetical protein
MKNAVFVSILVAVCAAVATAEDDQWGGDWDHDAHFGGEQEPDDRPRDISEAKRQGRAYRIGGKGMHRRGGKDVHIVREGDTLWDLSAHYFGDPWHWPELWSFNPEITNPHWIYPLDRIRLSPDVLTADQAVAKAVAAGGLEERAAGAGVLSGTESAPSVVVPRELIKPGTIFLRDQGYLDRDALRSVGQIIGGNEEQMFLSPSDQVYVRFREDQDVRAGQAYTVFRAMYDWEREEKEQGTLVRILGTVVIRSYDRERRVARGLLTEAMDPIERGMFVARLDRRFDLISPKRNDTNVVARIIASVQPRRLLAYNNVVFLDVGEGRGIEPGNRFFVVRRGDDWLAGLDVNDPRELGNIVAVPKYDPSILPKEVVAELRVLKVRKHTTIAVVTRADTDVWVGDVAEMRVGF